MSRTWDGTDTLDPITEEIRSWNRAGAHSPARPAARSSHRHRLFPRGWRDAMCAAWTLVALLALAVVAIAGWDILTIPGSAR